MEKIFESEYRFLSILWEHEPMLGLKAPYTIYEGEVLEFAY